MDIRVFSQNELPVVFRALRTALNPGATLSPEEGSFLETYARITDFTLTGDPGTISASDVKIEGAHPRKRLIQLGAMAVLLSRPVRAESVEYLHELARTLEVKDPVLKVLRELRKGHRLTAKLLTLRRGLRGILKETYLEEGVRGWVRFVAAMFLKARVNPERIWSYKRLGLLPEGTLGREYWKHLTEMGFGFPGEPGGIPQTVAYHDVSHVLTGNDTTPAGEIQQGSLQGGNRREDGFFFIQFVLLHFHQGIKITPAAPPFTGYFDPKKVLWAIHRGATCPVDMTHQWNFWPLMTLPLEEARTKVGLIPKLG